MSKNTKIAFFIIFCLLCVVGFIGSIYIANTPNIIANGCFFLDCGISFIWIILMGAKLSTPE